MSFFTDNAEAIVEIALGLWVLAVIARLIIVRFRSRRSIGKRRCAACGQIIFAREDKICTECGQDVRFTGVITAKSFPPIKFYEWVIAATLLLLVPGVHVAPYVANALPIGWHFQVDRLIGTGFPSNGPVNLIEVEAWGFGRYYGKHPDVIRVTGHWRIRSASGIEEFSIDPRTWTAETAGTPTVRGAFNPAFVQFALLSTLTGQDSKHQNEIITEVDQAVHDLARGNFSSEGNSAVINGDTVVYVCGTNMLLVAHASCAAISLFLSYWIVWLCWRFSSSYPQAWWLREARRSSQRQFAAR